mmetsp:Transcript_4675/g.10994  ORF Transcript_4675/g.10994 Transcript_4675/m.10994 type:complete len:1065 (-) Transcript_4675:124-3318(-)
MADQAAIDKAAQKAAKRKRTRQRVIEEILSSEESYVSSLSTLCDVFIYPLKNMARDPSKTILNQGEIDTVFSNIQLLKQLNSTFMENLAKEIKKGTDEKTDIGKTFMQFSQFFKMYTIYVNNYDNAVQFLKLKSKPRFEAFLADAVKSGKCKQPSLESYLIMPIQRIPRYKMLLEEVIKNTEPDHSDLSDLQNATEAIKKVAKHINEEVTRHKNREKILELENLFVGNVSLVDPSRVFIRHGGLVKKCRASNRAYEFILFNNLLVYASNTGLGRLKMHRKLDLTSNFYIQDLPDKPAKSQRDEDEINRFQIVSASKSFVVMASSKAEKESWLKSLNEQLQGVKKTIAGRRGSVSSINQFAGGPAPVWESDHSSTECNLCSRKFTMWTRRHHCRFCGILCCNSCSLKRLMVPVKEGSSKKEARRICDTCVEDFKKQSSRNSFRNGSGNTSISSSMSESALRGDSVSKPSPSSSKAASLPNNLPHVKEENDDMVVTPLTQPTNTPPSTRGVSPASKDPEKSQGGENPLYRTNPSDNYIPETPKSTSTALLGVVEMLYGYEAEAEGELTVERSELVEVYEMHENGWWNGLVTSANRGVKDAHGWFPSSYARLLDRYIAQFAFPGENDEDLSFAENEFVFVLNPTAEGGWWQGYKDGKVGIVPSNYLKKDPLPPPPKSEEKQEEEAKPATATATTTATTETQQQDNAAPAKPEQDHSNHASEESKTTVEPKLPKQELLKLNAEGGSTDIDSIRLKLAKGENKISFADDTSSDDSETEAERKDFAGRKGRGPSREEVRRRLKTITGMAELTSTRTPMEQKRTNQNTSAKKAPPPIPKSPCPTLIPPPAPPRPPKKDNTSSSPPPPTPPRRKSQEGENQKELLQNAPGAHTTPPPMPMRKNRAGNSPPPPRPRQRPLKREEKNDVGGGSVRPPPPAISGRRRAGSNSSAKKAFENKEKSASDDAPVGRKRAGSKEVKKSGPKKLTDEERQAKIKALEEKIAKLPQFNVKAMKAKAELAQLMSEDQMERNKKEIYSKKKKKGPIRKRRNKSNLSQVWEAKLAQEISKKETS